MTARCHRRGFTLLELLVVLVILAALAGAVTLASGGSAARRLAQAAERAQLLIELACERASATGTDVGWRVRPDGLQFGYLRAGQWLPIGADAGDELRLRELAEAVQVRGYRDGLPLAFEEHPEQAQLACFSSGELTPFELLIEHPGVAERWRLRASLDGRIERLAEPVAL